VATYQVATHWVALDRTKRLKTAGQCPTTTKKQAELEPDRLSPSSGDPLGRFRPNKKTTTAGQCPATTKKQIELEPECLSSGDPLGRFCE